MKLCLSARMFARAGARDEFELSVEDFVGFAKSLGYDGITLREGQLEADTPEEEVDRIADLLEAQNSPCSFVKTGTVHDTESLDARRRLLDHTLRIGCRNLQPAVRNEADIPHVQALCDYAAERDAYICPQLHNNTLHDTVPRCLELVRKIDRENFGINFEASHLLLQDAGIQNGDAVRGLKDRIFSVCVQNYKKPGDQMVPCLPGDPEGVDLKAVFSALREIGYDGFVTHMSGRYPDVENRAVCRAYIEYLRPLM